MKSCGTCKFKEVESAGYPCSACWTSESKPNFQLEATGIEAMVCKDIADRQALGIQKYKTTLADNPLELKEWLEHQYQELLDAALYCKRAIVQIETNEESK